MAEPKVYIRRSSVPGKIPTTAQLAAGELAVNTYDGKVYLEQDQGGVGVGTTVIVVNPWGVGFGSTAYNAYFTAGKVGIGITNPLVELQVSSGPVVVGSATTTGTASQNLQVTGGAYFSGSVGVGTTFSSESGITVLSKVQILQQSDSASRLIFRAKPGNAYRWNIDNDSTNIFRIFSEDDATSANGVVRLSISTTGTVSAAKFSGDGSLLTGITAAGSGVVVQNQSSTVGTAATLNFSTNLTASFSSGTATISLSNNPSISGILTADQVYTSNNGNGTNIRIGDDLWVGDINAANTTRFSGIQNSDRAFIVFGNSDTIALGRTGTGPLYYGGNFTIAGIMTANKFVGDGSLLTNLPSSSSSISISTNTTNSNQLIPYVTSYGSTTGLGATNNFVFNPSAGNLGIGTTNPQAPLQVEDVLTFDTTTTTTTTTDQVTIDNLSTSLFRSAKYQVQVTCPGQISSLGGITTGGRGYTSGTFNITFTTSSGTGSNAQGTLTISNGVVAQIGLGTTGGSGYINGDVLTATGGSGLQVSVASTASPTGRITGLTLSNSGTGYTGYYNSTTGTGTTSLAFLGGTGSGAVGLATIYDGVVTSSTLLQQPTTGTGGTTYYSGSNYTTSSVLTINKSDLVNIITGITGTVGVSTFTSVTAHGIGVSDVIRVPTSSNGLTAGTNYYVVTVPSSTTFTLGISTGIGTTFTTGTGLSLQFYRNSSRFGGSVAYTNAISGVSTNYQVSDLLVLQNGTTADYVEYASIANNDILGVFASDINSGNSRLLFSPTYPNNTIKVVRQAITL